MEIEEQIIAQRPSAAFTVSTAGADAKRVTVVLPEPDIGTLLEARAAGGDPQKLAVIITRESKLPMECVLHLPLRALHFACRHYGLES